MGKMTTQRQQGVALPVMLIILMVMLIGSVYLLKSSNSATMTSSNMAYDAALSKAVDLGLHKGFQYLQTQAPNRTVLQATDPANGYVAKYDPNVQVNDDAFWSSAMTVTNTANGSATGDTIQYVIHRACRNEGPYDDVGNACVQTTANPLASGSPVAPGDSLDASAPSFNSAPQIHYIITARIFGPRGGNVVNQMVVLIDA